MKADLSTFATVTAGVLLMSCSRQSDGLTDKGQFVLNANILREFAADINIQSIQNPPSNSLQYVQWIENYSASTNQIAEELRTYMGSIRINTNFQIWEPNKITKSPIAVVFVAQFKIGNETNTVAVTTSGELFPTTVTTDGNFLEINKK